MSNCFIYPIDRTPLDATPTRQSVSGKDVNEGILCISQISGITEDSTSDMPDTHWWRGLVWFLLFNGMSTFAGYLIPKPFS